MKRILLLAFVLVICFNLASCSSLPTDPNTLLIDTVNLIDEEYLPLENEESLHGLTDEQQEVKREIIKKIEEHLEALGFDSKDNLTFLDDTFMEKYIDLYSKDNLFESILSIQGYYEKEHMSPGEEMPHYWGEGCVCQELKNTINNFRNVAKIEMVCYDSKEKNAEGYYTKNPKAKPQPFTEEVQGEFYDSTGQNDYTQTKPKNQIVEYYGDFAISILEGYTYHKGRYEWVNGEFIDELPSWEPYKSYSLWYKGIDLTRFDSDFIPSRAKNFLVFPYEINSTTYYLHEYTDTNERTDDSHTYYKIEIYSTT